MSKDVVLGIVRHVLTSVGGAAASAGYLTQEDSAALVGGLVALVGVVWSIIANKK